MRQIHSTASRITWTKAHKKTNKQQWQPLTNRQQKANSDRKYFFYTLSKKFKFHVLAGMFRKVKFKFRTGSARNYFRFLFFIQIGLARILPLCGSILTLRKYLNTSSHQPRGKFLNLPENACIITIRINIKRLLTTLALKKSPRVTFLPFYLRVTFFIHTYVKAYAKRTVIFFDRVSEIIIICIIERIKGYALSVGDVFYVFLSPCLCQMFFGTLLNAFNNMHLQCKLNVEILLIDKLGFK